jgi:hypothetical protein
LCRLVMFREEFRPSKIFIRHHCFVYLHYLQQTDSNRPSLVVHREVNDVTVHFPGRWFNAGVPWKYSLRHH